MEPRIFPEGEIFHICNKSIANFGIFRDPANSQRFIQSIDYFNVKNLPAITFSTLMRKRMFVFNNLFYDKENGCVKILGYCMMPDHYHLLVKVLADRSVSKFISNIENSFTRFFNIKFSRKGPLWQSRFRAVLVESNEQLLHVSRYIHLNPTTAGLVEKPEDWEFSSYRNYIYDEKVLKGYLKEISIKDNNKYKKFVDKQKDYQKKLGKIKKLLLE